MLWLQNGILLHAPNSLPDPCFSPLLLFPFPCPLFRQFFNQKPRWNDFFKKKSKWTGPIRMCLERTPNFQGFLNVQARSRALLRLRVDLSQKGPPVWRNLPRGSSPHQICWCHYKIHIPPLPLGANGSFPRQGIWSFSNDISGIDSSRFSGVLAQIGW